jgi:excisionase family DNA binding protein
VSTPKLLLLTPKEAGRALGISDDSVYRLIAKGLIDTVDVGTEKRPRTRITPAALEAFINGRSSARQAS